MICNHFQIARPETFITHAKITGNINKFARNVFAYHLYDCGFSFVDVGRMIKTTPDAARACIRDCKSKLEPSDIAMLAELPRISATQKIMEAMP